MTRPRLQLHLTTCLVLMIAASALVAVNVLPREYTYFEFQHGWPFPAWHSETHAPFSIVVVSESESSGSATNPFAAPPQATQPPEINLSYAALAANVAVALLLLLVLAFVCQMLRRRFRRFTRVTLLLATVGLLVLNIHPQRGLFPTEYKFGTGIVWPGYEAATLRGWPLRTQKLEFHGFSQVPEDVGEALAGRTIQLYRLSANPPPVVVAVNSVVGLAILLLIALCTDKLLARATDPTRVEIQNPSPEAQP